MPRLKGKRKTSHPTLEQIGPALLPAAALTAVPFCPNPQALQGRALTLSLDVFSGLAARPQPNADLGEPEGGESGGAAAYPHDGSFDEDENMEEAGYTTVRNATQLTSGANRKSYSDRERASTPPTGDVYHILEPDAEDPAEADIYAVPIKGTGPAKNQKDEDASSLDCTQQDVRKAMQAIHDIPVEETMNHLSDMRQASGPHLGSSSGRGTMWRDEDDEEDSDEEPPPLPPPPADFQHDSGPEELQQHMNGAEAPPQHMNGAEAPPQHMNGAEAPPQHMNGAEAPPQHMNGAEAPPQHMNGAEAPPQHMNGAEAPPQHMNGVEALSQHMNGVEALSQHMNGVEAPPQHMYEADDSSAETTTEQVSEGKVSVTHVSAQEQISARRVSTPGQFSARRVSTPKEGSVRHVSSPKEVSVGHISTPKEASVRCVSTPKEASVRLVSTPKEASARHSTPKEASVRLVSTPKEASARHSTPKEASVRLVSTPKEASARHSTPKEASVRLVSTPKEASARHSTPKEASVRLVSTPKEASARHSTPKEASVRLVSTPKEASARHISTPKEASVRCVSTPKEVHEGKGATKRVSAREEISQRIPSANHPSGVATGAGHQVEVKGEAGMSLLKHDAHTPRSTGSGSGAQWSQHSTTPRDAPSLPLEGETTVKRREQGGAQQGKTANPTPARSGGGSGSSGRSDDPQRSVSLSALQREVEKVKEQNQHLLQEVAGLRKVTFAVVGTGGDNDGGRSVGRGLAVEELKSENEVLKNAVGRLNQELSQYQATFRPLSQDDINKRYLAPLFLAYDDVIQEKEEVVRRCQAELQTLRERTQEVVRENQRYLHRGSSVGGPAIAVSDWQALQQQARLVLEENQVLTEQVDVQHRKVKNMCSAHIQEVSRLTQRLTASQQEREEMERELEETRSKLKDVKQKHDKMQLEALKHTSMHSHFNSVAGLQRSVTEEREQMERETEEMMNKVLASDEEQKRQAQLAIETEAENKQLKAELSALHDSVRKSQSKLVLLQKAVRQSESQELVTQNELANVIKIVEKTALERDTAFRVAKEKQRDCKNTVSQIRDSTVVMGRMEKKLQMYKLRASAKLQTVSEKLKEQDDLFNHQRQEYEREIGYLRCLLKEREERISQMKGERREAEESLEVVWQAARSENQRLKETLTDSVHKLRQHPPLHCTLQEDEDLDKLLHFSASP
ncbi:uncharacterized protein LOC143300357 isoform X2 [Babylonia areolata]|uniref:uncharacterized protein LOC143300357 isoform X2 n=1 Tax=Babylonia areolata TaxID=304850 RepID=UPI003FD110A2